VIDAVQEVEVDMSTEMASMFRIRFGIAPTAIGDWSLLEADIFRPLVPVTIRVASGALPVPFALISGYVTSQRANYSLAAGDSTLEVTGMDATVLMNQEEKVKSWPNLPDSGIAAAIFGQYAILPRVQPGAPQLVEPEGTTTQRSTDIRFLRRLAQRNGFDCYVQPEPLTGIDQGYFQPPQITGLPQAVLNVNMGTDTNVTDFQVNYDMLRSTTAVGAGIDVLTKAVQPALAPASLQLPMGAEPALTRILPPPIARIADTGLMRTGEIQSMAQAVADRSSFSVMAEGRVDTAVGILRPGGFVNIRGLGRLFNGSYYLTQVSHTINREGHMQRFRALRNAVTMTGAEVFVSI
jgi:phage protein D